MFSFNVKRINFDEEIGVGTQGTVYAYQHKNPEGEKYVVKRITTSQVDTMLLSVQEIVLGFGCDHPNVLPIKGYHIAYDKDKRFWDIYIKMPRMERSLDQLIDQYAREGNFFKEDQVVRYFYSLTLGLGYLHGKCIAHRDIKPNNILIDKYDQLRIADIGIGKFIEDENTENLTCALGTRSYTAPEILAGASGLKKKTLFKADIWSLGVIIAEICVPKRRLVNTNANGEVNQANLALVLRGLQGRYKKVLLELILGLLQADPDKRKSFREVQQALEENYPDILELKQEVKRTHVSIDSRLNGIQDNILAEGIKKKAPSINSKLKGFEGYAEILTPLEVADISNRRFFINFLTKQIEPLEGSRDAKLSLGVYHRLQDLLTKILRGIIQQSDYDSLAQLLPLLNRYYTHVNSLMFYDNRNRRTDRTMTLWEDSMLWKELMKYLLSKKILEEKQKHEETLEENSQKYTFNKLWNFGKQVFKTDKKPAISESEISSFIMRELAFYLARLTKNIVIASELVLRVGFDANLDRKEMAEIIYNQKNELDSVIRLKISNYKVAKRRKAELKWRRYYPFYLALDYLEPVDMLKLVALSSAFKHNFKKKVYRAIFYNFGETITVRQRLKIWQNILNLEEINLSYKDLLRQYQQMPAEKSVESRILSACQGPFHNHPAFNQSVFQVLQELLKAFAAFASDKDIMDYEVASRLMGFLYIKTQDPDITFKIFVRIMNRFQDFAGDNKKITALCCFKFVRLLELYTPDLAEHFKNEKITPIDFLPSWFSTIFTNSFDSTTGPKLLERIWDFFLLDGLKVTFKTSLLILMEYKNELLNMKYEGVVTFLRNIEKGELFKNGCLDKVISGENQASTGYKFIKNYGPLMRYLHVTKTLFKTFDGDFEVLETRINRLLPR